MIAYITMVIDHVGWIFFPHVAIFRIIGRLSFPLFAFLLAEGSLKTKDDIKYRNRLLTFAAISQIPYSYASYLAHANIFELNIFFTLAAGLFLIMFLQKKQYERTFIAFLLLSAISLVIPFDYDMYGLLIIVSSYFFITKRTIGVIGLVASTVGFYALSELFNMHIGTIQLFALAAIPLIALYNGEKGIPMPRLATYFFYPLHLIVLSLLFHLL